MAEADARGRGTGDAPGAGGAAPAERPGTPFGRYLLQRRIALGGMAELFLATMAADGGFEKRVVVKRILPQYSADPGFVQMFKDEAAVAGRLSHPNLVQVYDFGQVDGVFFMTLEYVDGGDLRQILRECRHGTTPLGYAEVAAVGEGVARGLAYAHAYADDTLGPLHIVHRDISPHNIMLSRSGDVKVMDFGIAKAAARATLTATGVLKGKAAYMAPEQAVGGEVDGRCDQFALGIVLWECVAGRRLFEGSAEVEILRKVTTGQPRPLREVVPDVPPELEAVIMRCLSREPGDRFADMEQVERALASWRYSLGPAGVVRLGAVVEALVPRQLRVAVPAPLLELEPRAAEPRDVPRSRSGTATVPAEASSAHGPPRVTASLPRELAAGERPAALAEAPTVTMLPDLERAFGPSAGARPRRRAGSLTRLWRPALVLAGIALLGLAWLAASRQAGLEGPEEASSSPPPVASPSAPADGTAAAPPARVPTPSAVLPPVVPDRPVAPADTTLPTPAPRPARRGPPELVTQPPRTQAKLSVRSTGWFLKVYADGRYLGDTPLTDAPVPAGRLRLRFVNAEAGFDSTQVVDVRPGEARQVTVEAGPE